MSKTGHASNPQYHVHSLYEYVLTPLVTATSRVEHERAEVATERDAFQAFRDRVADIEAEQSSSPFRCIAANTGRATCSDAFALVRSAYRETVMDVPHYETVYGEPLIEHVAAEFGPNLAEQLHETNPTSFTVPLREALRMAAQRAVEERRALLEQLNEEVASVETARSEIRDLLQPLSSTVIPEWHRETFVRQLGTVAERRQETLHTRGDLPDGSEYPLSTYLYGDAGWSHPVLTAVARTRETVTLGESNNRPSSPGCP